MTVEDNKTNEEICIKYCAECPSYPRDSGEWLYCARGKSTQNINREGCLCPGCEVFEKYGLTSTYYCEKGVTE